MEKRQNGEVPTLETRSEAHEKVDRKKRYRQILECLTEYPYLTAKECADLMWRKGYIPNNERNFTAPRLTEMCEQGTVEPIGKRVCQWTGKKVAVYQIRRGNNGEGNA